MPSLLLRPKVLLNFFQKIAGLRAEPHPQEGLLFKIPHEGEGKPHAHKGDSFLGATCGIAWEGGLGMKGFQQVPCRAESFRPLACVEISM